MITVTDAKLGDIQSGKIGHTSLHFFLYHSLPTALYGVDIHDNIGTTTITIQLHDGTHIVTPFFINKLTQPTEYLPVPAQIGGNSPENQIQTVSTLSKENTDLASIYSSPHKVFWASTSTNPFIFPIASTTGNPLIVTNSYGYERSSGVATIVHKGVDFRAPPGTPIYAISNGYVRTAKTYTIYGESVIIDHGLGLLSMYMHLSKMLVAPDQFVQKGQLLGYSGETGYSEGPHLHLTIRIGGRSIDPMKFFTLFGVK